MARGRQEARLAAIGLLGLPPGGTQCLCRAPALGNIVDHQQDFGLPIRPLGKLAGIEQQEPPTKARELDLCLVGFAERGIGLHPREECA
jgi:hypothetical protein